MSDLKPCPFCGGEPELLDYRTVFRVECETCIAGVNGDRAPEPESEEHCESINWKAYEKTAIDRWNNRPQENKLKAQAVRDWARQAEANNESEDRMVNNAYDYANKLERGEL